jgi:hypothetical protein
MFKNGKNDKTDSKEVNYNSKTRFLFTSRQFQLCIMLSVIEHKQPSFKVARFVEVAAE